MTKLIRDGIALAHQDGGSGARPILLVHGWCCDHTYMVPQYQHFIRRHRVISVDLRGHGESDQPEQDYTPAGFADDLAWLCRELHIRKPIVIGHSMGGNIAFELARQHPDLPAAIVALDSAILPCPWVVQAVKQHLAKLRTPDYRMSQREFVSGFFLPTDDSDLKAEILCGMSSVPQHVMTAALESHVLSWNGPAALAACRVPALLVGSATWLTDVKRLQEYCAGVVVGQTVGAGHFNNRLVPEQVNAMIDSFMEKSNAAFSAPTAIAGM